MSVVWNVLNPKPFTIKVPLQHVRLHDTPSRKSHSQVGRPAIRNISGKAKQEEQINLRVDERLQDLTRVPLTTVRTVLVVSLAADDHEPLVTLEPGSHVGRVGDEDPEDDGPEGAEGTNDEELVLPGLKRCVDLMRPIGKIVRLAEGGSR